MKRRRTFRLIALLLSVLLLMQCAVAAAEPGQDEAKDDKQAPIEITASISDGHVVNQPQLSFTVSAVQDKTALKQKQITVKLGKNVIEPDGDSYAVKLQPGDNTVTITAESGGATETRTLTVRYDIVIPGGWARKALKFCVKYGILKGDQNGDLNATSNATRAELAAMLVRLFNARPKDSLERFTDVSSDEWYYNEMARAVAMGIYKGSGDKLNPTDRITREEAFVVLARAFGVVSATQDALNKVPDRTKVSAWARNSVAGMLEAELIHGYTDGSLDPKGYITRQELAQVLYNALDCITDNPDKLTGKSCLYTGPVSALEGKAINGNLIVSCPDQENVQLNELKVSGRLVLHLHEVKKATLGGGSKTISLCSPTRLTLKEPVKTVNCLRDGASVTAEAELAVVDGKGTIHGSYDKTVFLSGRGVIAEDASVDVVEANASLTVNGSVAELHARGRGATIKGGGEIGTVYKHHNDLVVDCQAGNIVDRVDAGLEGVQIVSGTAPDVYYDANTVTVTGTVTGVNSTQIFDVPDGVRVCTVTYRYGGKVLKTDEAFRLTEGAALSCEVTPDLKYQVDEEQSVSVTIAYLDEVVEGKLKLHATGRFSPLHEAQNIRSFNVTAEVNYTTSIFSYSSLSGAIGSVAKGTIVYFVKDGESSSLIQTREGLRGWVPNSAIRVGWRTYYDNSVSYSTEAKEAFVNQLHDYSSSTRYLIWVNLFSTTVNIFEGSKGEWKLIKSDECAIGAASTPTRQGTFSIYAKTYYWTFDDSRCYYVSLFDGGIALHTRLKYINSGSYVNPNLSAMLSHGCVRCPDEVAQFIYNNCPIGTRVVVY